MNLEDFDSGLPTATPREVGLDAGRLQQLSEAFAARVSAGSLAGAVIAIMRRGRVCWVDAIGYRDAQQGIPMTADSLFRLYSMTKPIASIAAMTLAEQGSLLLAEPVSTWLPSFANQQVAVVEGSGAAQSVSLVPAQTPATVRDLLRHTAGLQNEVLFETNPVKDAYRRAGLASGKLSLAEWTDVLGAQPLAYHPGTVFDYSHATAVLGRVLEVVSGEPLDRFIARTVTGPLGMRDTAFQIPQQDWLRLAEPTLDRASGQRPALLDLKSRRTMLSAGAGLAGTARDYLRFTAMLLNGGELDGVRILSPATLSFVLSDHLGGIRTDTTSARVLLGGYGFGLGFAVRPSKGSAAYPGSVGDAYWGGMAGTQFWVDPSEQLAAVLLIQQPAELFSTWPLVRQMVYAAVTG
jgi:CubicO group peptidase (beta-lactamase class C family)